MGLVYDLAKCETPSIGYDMAETSLSNTVLEHLDNTKCHTVLSEHLVLINLFNPQNNIEAGSGTIYFVFTNKEIDLLTDQVNNRLIL